MSELDLDELRSELGDFAQPEKKGGRSARDERVIAGMAVRRSTGKTATSSSGCTLCASTASASWPTAAPCLKPSIIKDCSTGQRRPPLPR